MRLLLLISACLLLGAGGYFASTKLGKASAEKSSPPKTIPAPGKPVPAEKSTTPVTAAAPGKPPAEKPAVEAKPLSLTEAIQLVELSNKGDVVRAEKLGTGKDISFDIEATTPEGRKNLHVDALGKSIAETPLKNKGKKKGKKHGDEEDD